MDIGVGGVLRRCGRKHVVKFLLRRFYKADEIRPVHILTLRRTPVVHPNCRIFIAHSSSCFSMYTFYASLTHNSVFVNSAPILAMRINQSTIFLYF